jgi:hypothetical protein
MKIYRNISEIKRKEKLGRRLSLGGLGVLFIGLLVSFLPLWNAPTDPAAVVSGDFMQLYGPSIVSLVALVGGFVLATFGSYYTNRFASRRWPGSRFYERPDEVLERNLKGFDDKYSLYLFSLPAAYVLTGPNGVTLLAVRTDKGRVTVQGDKWREPFSVGRLLTAFGREGVGNPGQDLAEQEVRIRALLGAEGADGEGKVVDPTTVPIDGAAVFLNQDIVLDVSNPSVPALRGDQLKDYVRGRAKQLRLANATQRGVDEILVSHATYQAPDSGG